MQPSYPEITVTTDDWTAEELIGGKSASDLQTGLTIGDGAFTGTLKYVTGYTQFSGDVELQSGNYFAVKVESDEGAEIVAGIGEERPTLQADGIVICRVADKTTDRFRVDATKNGLLTHKEYDLSGLTLESAPVAEE